MKFITNNTKLAIFGFGTFIGAVATHLIIQYLKSLQMREENFELRDPENEYQLVLGLRSDVGVLNRRVVACCAEFTITAYRNTLQSEPESVDLWFKNGWSKIAVKVYSRSDLFNLHVNAIRWSVRSFILTDIMPGEGATASWFLVVIGPAPRRILNHILRLRDLY